MAKGKELLRGRGRPGSGPVVGKVHILLRYDPPAKWATIKPSEIWVGDELVPEQDEYFETAAALIQDLGAWTAHGAIQAANQGKACVVGTMSVSHEFATQVLKDGQMVLVDGCVTKDALGRCFGAVYEYIPDQPPSQQAVEAKAILAQKLAQTEQKLTQIAGKGGKEVSPELAEKMKRLGL